MVPVPPPVWELLLQALAVLIAGALGSTIIVWSCAACFLLFSAYGIPWLMDRLEELLTKLEAFCRWSWRKRRPILISATAVFLSSVTVLWQWYFYWDTDDVPDMMEMINYAPPQIGYVYDSRGEVMVELANVFRKPVQYTEIPLVLEHATIAAEDKNFYEHDGIPVLCMSVPFADTESCLPVPLELVWRWISGKGGSTLTMQLVRNHYLNDMLARERTDALVTDNCLTRKLAEHFGAPWVNRRMRKLREIKYALHLERQLNDYARRQIEGEMRDRGFWLPQRWLDSRRLSKRRAKELLMARYLSTVYYGYSMYGPDSASRFYFNKPMADLKVDEAALLASFAPAPSKYAQLASENGTRTRQRERRNRVIRRMGEKGFIATSYDCGRPANIWDSFRWFLKADLPRGDCRDDVAHFSNRSVQLVGRLPGGRTEAPASVQTALDEIESRGFSDRRLFDGAIRLHTTVDLRLQQIVNRAAQRGAQLYREYYPDTATQPQIAIIVLRNRDAAILAQFGGFTADVPNSWTHLDRSRKSRRQAGSIFKMFVYLATLVGGGHTPDSLVNDDRPYGVRMGGGWTHYVENYDYAYKGWMPFRESLAQSRNVPAMHLGMEYTNLHSIIDTARNAGIHSPMKSEPSMILGAGDFTLIELANGFRAIASGGIATEPYIIGRVTNSFGDVLDEHHAQPHPLSASPEAVTAMQELLRGAVRLPSGTSRGAAYRLPEVPLMAKTGTSNNFADARVAAATYGPDGITVAVWVGRDDTTNGLGESASGGRLALPVAEYIFGHAYDSHHHADNRPTALGAPPVFPPDMEARITAYIEKAYPKP